MTAAVRKFFALSTRDRALVAEAAMRLAMARLAIRVMPAATWRRLRSAQPAQRRAIRSAATQIDGIRWAIQSVGRRFASTTCLVQALAADAMMRQRGYASRIRVGVKERRSESDGLQAHAWVECDGAIVLGDQQDFANYAPLSARTVAPPHAIAALAALPDDEVAAWSAIGLGPAEFLEVCAHDDLIGLVHHRLGKLSSNRDWPPDVVEELARSARALAATEMLRRNETVAVLDALVAKGVRPVLIKGTALAYDVYEAPHLRPRTDTDLVISRDHVGIVRDTLSAQGYQATTYSGGERLFCQFEVARRDRFGVDHAFDFHWKISTQPAFADVLTYAALAEHAVALPRLGPNALGAGPVHALLLGCIHPVMHHRGDERPIWIYDVHLLASRLTPSQTEGFVNLAMSGGVAAVCAHELTLAREWFGRSISEDVIRGLAAAGNTERSAEYLHRRRTWLAELRSSLRGLPRWRERLQLLREVIFPNPRYMMASYGLAVSARSSTLLPVIYAHRVVYGVWKVLTGTKK